MNIKQIALDCGATTNDYGRPNYLELSIKQLEVFAKALEAEQVCQDEAPTQEPYGWVYEECIDDADHAIGYFYREAFSWIELKNGTPVYTHPKEWQGLSNDDLYKILNDNIGSSSYAIARAIEAKLRERNT